VLTSHQASAAWQWSAGTSGADRTLFTIALDACDLLLSPSRSRIRVCEGAGCGWFFIDRSKAGRRRWCNMAVCGNRVKVRSYRERVARV
jgi:predicted RNA-binding Zn ribbon-like protein